MRTFAWSIALAALVAGSCGGPSTPAPAPPVASPASKAPPAEERDAAPAEAAPPVETAAAPPEPAAPDRAPDFEPLKWTDADLARIAKVQPIVAEAAQEYGVDPLLVDGVIWVESKFNPRARGPAGARGLMQLMPRTSKFLAQKIGRPHRPYDAAFNIHAGAYYIGRLLGKADGNEDLALAGYARGLGRMKARVEAGEPLPEGVQRFIARVRRARDSFALAISQGRLPDPRVPPAT